MRIPAFLTDSIFVPPMVRLRLGIDYTAEIFPGPFGRRRELTAVVYPLGCFSVICLRLWNAVLFFYPNPAFHGHASLGFA